MPRWGRSAGSMPFGPLCLVLMLGLSAAVPGQEPPKPVVVPLYPAGSVPGAVGTDAEKDVPTITLYRPAVDRSKGATIVVCPGGGYGHLALGHEGKDVADWLNRAGLTAAVLKYRLGPRYHHPVMLHDAQRALRTVRARAAEWGLDPARVAILGFSAGGHLASTVGTHFDAGRPDTADPIERQSARPDRMILVYPVIAIATPYGHTGSKRNLLGTDPPAELVASLSNETQVKADTPPTFLVHTNADKSVPPENSLLFALALRKAGVPLELHIFENGQHGLGLAAGRDPAFAVWPRLCETWLTNQGFLPK